MKSLIIIAAIVGVFVLGMLGSVSPTVPSSLKHSEPDSIVDVLSGK